MSGENGEMGEMRGENCEMRGEIRRNGENGRRSRTGKGWTGVTRPRTVIGLVSKAGESDRSGRSWSRPIDGRRCGGVTNRRSVTASHAADTSRTSSTRRCGFSRGHPHHFSRGQTHHPDPRRHQWCRLTCVGLQRPPANNSAHLHNIGHPRSRWLLVRVAEVMVEPTSGCEPRAVKWAGNIDAFYKAREVETGDVEKVASILDTPCLC